MNIGLMKGYTGLMVKEITPALHKLQEAFLVFEDQADNEGDRSWYLFEAELPEVNLLKYTKSEALQLLIPRFAKLCVTFDESMIKSYYKVPGKLIKEALTELEKNKILIDVTLDGKSGYLLSEDYEILEQKEEEIIVPSVLLLQRNDFLVRAYAEELKVKFTSEWDTLYYILIDGEFHGAVMGRFKFGPHVIEDIALDLTEEELNNRRDEIIKAISSVFDPINSPIKRFNGINCK